MENFYKENKKDKQLDNLINLVEKHTRTERHLEKYSNLDSKQDKENAREIQKNREEGIRNLKEKLNGSDIQTKDEQIQNLEKKYENTNQYIKNNREEMNVETLRKLGSKQENRKNQLENLKDY